MYFLNNVANVTQPLCLIEVRYVLHLLTDYDFKNSKVEQKYFHLTIDPGHNVTLQEKPKYDAKSRSLPIY